MDKLFIPVDDTRLVSQYFDELAVLLKSFNKITLTSTVQFNHRVSELKDFLSKNHEVITCPSVLGCRAVIPEADCTVVITTGVFHAIKVALTTGNPVFILGPGGVSRLDDKLIKDFKKKQSIRVSKVLDSKVIGVLVSTKPGQEHELLASKIVSKLEAKGKEAFMFVANELSPSQVNDFPVDAWINTACPRIVEDEFEKPIANWDEVNNYLS